METVSLRAQHRKARPRGTRGVNRAMITARRHAKRAIRPRFAREIIDGICAAQRCARARPKTTYPTTSTPAFCCRGLQQVAASECSEQGHNLRRTCRQQRKAGTLRTKAAHRTLPPEQRTSTAHGAVAQTRSPRDTVKCAARRQTARRCSDRWPARSACRHRAVAHRYFIFPIIILGASSANE